MEECLPCFEGYVAPNVGTVFCTACNSGSYSIANASTGCTECVPGWFQPQAHTSACDPCAKGTSTNGKASSSSCEYCEEGYYCSHTGCGTCDRVSITEYTDGVGAFEPSGCGTWDAILGFAYPGQCWITWIILGSVVLFCMCGLGLRFYGACCGGGGGNGRTTVIINEDEHRRDSCCGLKQKSTLRCTWTPKEDFR